MNLQKNIKYLKKPMKLKSLTWGYKYSKPKLTATSFHRRFEEPGY